MNGALAESPLPPERAQSESRPSAPETAVRVDVSPEGIANVIFDRPASRVNILDSGTLGSLRGVLDDLTNRQGLRGIIFLSSKPGVFIAGADLRELSSAADPKALVDLGQQTFSKIASMRCPTVAAIHGACAGGGLELALACNYRVASRHRSTRIGLPEVNLGLIPAWGGCTRLPRLVGLQRAMQVILRGELAPAPKALAAGIVDALVPQERLVEAATRILSRGKRARFGWFLWIPAAASVAAMARRSVLRKTRGNYPAPIVAVDVVAKSVCRDIATSLECEKEAILELAGTSACRHLIGAFFLQERAKHLPAPKASPVQKALVVGAGVMGAGIAQWLSANGTNVLLRDVDPGCLARGLQQASSLFADAKRRGLMSAAEAQAGMDRIAPMEADVPLHSVDLVIEAAVEKMEVKKQIFANLERRTRPETVFATNTSALSVAEIGRDLQNPERIVGLHFFNPPHRMKLVEVVRCDATSAATLDTAIAFMQRVGKLPVVVRDSPGFLVNRILLPYLLEAAHLFEAGVGATVLDDCMMDFGMPMGPMRLLDEVGLDIAADVAQSLCGAFPHRMQVPRSLAKLLDAGFRGRKSNAGFYSYRGGRPAGPSSGAKRLQTAKAGIPPEECQCRMVLLMVNEAARCLEEKIVDRPEDVDFSMMMGTGFAPFRGGPLRHADAVGIEAVVADLQRLSSAGGAGFEPCERLLEMSRGNRKFYDG